MEQPEKSARDHHQIIILTFILSCTPPPGLSPQAGRRCFCGLNSLSQNLTVLPAPSGREPLAWRQSFQLKRKVCGRERSLEGAVAQRLRGCKSAEPEKTVKRSSRRTGVNLQFFPVEPTSLGLKGASSPFFVAPARRNRWHFSGSLLVSKENIPGKQKLPRRAAVFSLLHLLCQKGRCHCYRLALGVLRAGGAVLGQQTHRAGHVPARQYRCGA